MRYQARRFPLTPDKTVRLLLTAVMGLVLAVMVLLSGEQAAAQSAVQQPYGISRDQIVAQLGARYKEVPVAGGIATNGNILEVFSSADGRSWTIIVTRPDGMSSVIAEGEGWSFVTAVKGLRV
jgi:hypothetical protein